VANPVNPEDQPLHKERGYCLRVTYKNFPGMNVEYVGGPRTMNVFGEVMANGKDLNVDLSTFGRWEAAASVRTDRQCP
jgi:hypothetical protein